MDAGDMERYLDEKIREWERTKLTRDERRRASRGEAHDDEPTHGKDGAEGHDREQILETR